MTQEFVTYEQALALKELGFDEPCFGYYDNIGKLFFNTNGQPVGNDWVWVVPTDAPLYQQAFRWLRHKHNCVCEIIRKEVGNHSEFIGWVYIDDRKIDVVSYWDSKSYEEAEDACINKLIELVKSKI